MDELPNLATDTIDGDIEVALEKLRRVVNRVIVVDLTREEIGIPVVRAIILGFEVYARNPENLRGNNRKKKDGVLFSPSGGDVKFVTYINDTRKLNMSDV